MAGASRQRSRVTLLRACGLGVGIIIVFRYARAVHNVNNWLPSNFVFDSLPALDNASLNTSQSPVTKRPLATVARMVPTTEHTFQFDKDSAEAFLAAHGAHSFRKTLSAYTEPPLNDTIPGTGDRGTLQVRDPGTPPEFRIPLPLRTTTPDDLVRYEYPRVQTCSDVPGKWPVDRGLVIDEQGDVVAWNVGGKSTPDDFPQQEAPYCPVELDPFLPWIHDVFPTTDGKRIEFIAQNKRRCRTGKRFTADVNRLVPQVALMQPVSVERLSETAARLFAPELWYPDDDDTAAPRYRLAPFNESAAHGQFTRFICRFHATDFGSEAQTIVLGETLSEYPFNYEYVSYRKGKPNLLTASGKSPNFLWASVFRFSCPLPELGQLQEGVSEGAHVLSDGTPTLYVDLVPIRTSARYNEVYLSEEFIGPRSSWMVPGFDPVAHWGSRNVLPRIEASGRWANIPICLPAKPPVENDSPNSFPVENEKTKPTKPQFLAACLWTSTEFKTRGVGDEPIRDTMGRMEEWIEFHLMVGIDHVYLYDNSGAHTNETSLEGLTERFPGKVTRFEWPAVPCNNNVPSHDSPGERSSQYAAENSCRTRIAPFTEWVAVLDTDEYFVPMGNYTNLKDVIRDHAAQGANILSFRSSRSRLRPEACDPVNNGLVQRGNVTYLLAYNCDSAGSPKPQWADRARKQIYRADYVQYHYVHYSTVTEDLLKTYSDPGHWQAIHREPASDRVVPDELTEAVMVHAKTVKFGQTLSWKEVCHKDFVKKGKGCFVAVPWPDRLARTGNETYNDEGLLYNCFVNHWVDEYWVPRLVEAMHKRKAARESKTL